ncbi:MAG: hypothetical protein M1819_000125 [Sarea resinae]|nr:MAG: hypothetical protein M1819_000125 [Sarea resinae]
MPTPSHNVRVATQPSPPIEVQALRAQHATCPIDEERPSVWQTRSIDGLYDDDRDDDDSNSSAAEREPLQQPTLPVDSDPSGPLEAEAIDQSPRLRAKELTVDDDASSGDAMSPMSGVQAAETKDTADSPVSLDLSSPVVEDAPPSSSMGYEFSNVRLLPNSTSSFLHSGSKFHGTQQSDSQVYDVQVEIKHVDMHESFLCGYLRIQGLTEDHPTLTTYFEGEIIGTKYTFQTRHAEWGSNEKVDMQHWARFPSWRPLAKQARRPDFNYKNFAQRENIFMRWKEYFLVPDHRVRTISGASFEGFYYICFNQVLGTVSGIYFHAKSEK